MCDFKILFLTKFFNFVVFWWIFVGLLWWVVGFCWPIVLRWRTYLPKREWLEKKVENKLLWHIYKNNFFAISHFKNLFFFWEASKTVFNILKANIIFMRKHKKKMFWNIILKLVFNLFENIFQKRKLNLLTCLAFYFIFLNKFYSWD